MNIKETIAEISRMKWELENALEENGGELTDELLEQADALEDLKALLAGEGVDELGRWLKSVQDEIATRKAEADAAARKLKNLKSYEDYIKSLIGQALDAIGAEKVKGTFYGFKRTTSTKTTLNTEMLDHAFMWKLEMLLEEAQLPGFVGIAIKTTTTAVKEWAENHGGEGSIFINVDESPAISFTKPRAKKEE